MLSGCKFDASLACGKFQASAGVLRMLTFASSLVSLVTLVVEAEKQLQQASCSDTAVPAMEQDLLQTGGPGQSAMVYM